MMMNETTANFGSEENEDDLAIDMSGIDENASSFEALPRGMYDAVVDNVEFTKSQSSGNPMWSWTFQIEGGEFAGRKLFYHSVFIEKTLPRVKKDLARVAPELLQGTLKPKQIADEGALLGKRVKLQVDVRMYEGQKRNNVKQLLTPSAEGGEGGFFPT